MESDTEKACSRCKQSKPLGDFGLDNRRGTPKAICKPCDSEIHRLRPVSGSEKRRKLIWSTNEYQRRKDNGQCWRCDKPSTSGVYCDEHAAMRARESRIKRAAKVRICPACNNTPLGYREKHCSNCSDRKGARFRAYQSRWRFEQRLKAFEQYGGVICVCCGESNPKFLTMDHVNGDGATHRREIGRQSLYRWLKRHNYPAGFRVLCFNCNCGREYNGGICPHEEVKAQSSHF